MKNKGILYKTRVYLAGNIENCDNLEWRAKISQKLKRLGIVILNPTKKVFLDQVQETEKTRCDLIWERSQGNYKFVHDFMKEVIRKDLRQIDLCDFTIINLDYDKPSFGTIHEIVKASEQRKPLLFLIKDKKRMPLWIIGLINMDFCFESDEELMDYLKNINSGKEKLDPKYWKILVDELK